jgi:hypothetical protein
MQRTAMYIEKGLYSDLVKIGLECLELFDVRIPAKPTDEMVLKGNFLREQIHIKKYFHNKFTLKFPISTLIKLLIFS